MLFNPFIFIGGIVVGIFLVYAIKPDIKSTLKYPHPDNVGKLTYKDNNGICYQYKADKVDCSANKDKQVPYPLQN
jgi:hypothetical protein